MSKSKIDYYEFCKNNPDLCIFFKPWWLDAVCGAENWDVIVLSNSNEIIAVWPYYIVENYGFKRIIMPKATPYMGPWLRVSKAKYSEAISEEKKILLELISKLPKVSKFYQNFSPEMNNWLPFHWAGFQQSNGVTYTFDELGNQDELWKAMRGNARREIKKAINRFELSIADNISLRDFYKVYSKTFSRQGKSPTVDFEHLQLIDKACSSNKSSKILAGVDRNTNIHAVAYLVWDDTTCYYLLGGGDPDFRTSGAATFVLWECMKFAETVSNRFDLEGSMIEAVEKFFVSLGSKQSSYNRISKVDSSILKIVQTLKQFNG